MMEYSSILIGIDSAAALNKIEHMFACDSPGLELLFPQHAATCRPSTPKIRNMRNHHGT